MKKFTRFILVALMLSSVLSGCSKSSSNKEAFAYTIVAEGYDWGASVSKVVIDTNEKLNGATLDVTDFTITGTKKFVSIDYTTGATNDIQLDLTPTIVAVYTSDENGIATEKSQYLTIEMKVLANDAKSTLFYNNTSNQKVVSEFSFNVVLNPAAEVAYADGSAFAFNELKNEGFIYPTLSNWKMDGTYKVDDITLTYASYEPASAEKGKTPLIVWLHGGGEGGTDTKQVMLGERTTGLAEEAVQKYFGETGAYVLVPQVPTFWMDLDGKGNNIFYSMDTADGSNYFTVATAKLIQDFIAENENIDPSRVYVGGASNGGYMTLELMIYYPDMIAAAFPVCEGYAKRWLNDTKFAELIKTPTWFTASMYDGAFPIYEGTLDQKTYVYNPTLDANGNGKQIDNYSVYAYNEMKNRGGNVVFDVLGKIKDASGKYFNPGSSDPYDYNGHFSWIPTLNGDIKQVIDGKEVNLFEWLAKFSK